LTSRAHARIFRFSEHRGWAASRHAGSWEATIDPVATAERIREASRVHVVGGPGLGKSSFAQKVAAVAGAEVHHLDEIAFDGPDFSPRPEELTASEARAIAAQPRWVAEGIFVGWVEPLFEEADVIVWLDNLRWDQAVRRIVVRWARQALHEATIRRGAERFFRFRDYARHTKQLIRVLVTSREYWNVHGAPRRYTVTREQVRAALDPYQGKVVRLSRADEAEEVLRLVDPQASATG
jgi:adenylate kinase family enzyme